jgi:Rod binding domain-containing protein
MSTAATSLHMISPGLAAPTPALSRGGKAAQEFEAQLIGSLLESMEKTFATLPGESDLPGAENYNYMGTEALSSAVAKAGGFGIAAMIDKYLEKHQGMGSS